MGEKCGKWKRVSDETVSLLERGKMSVDLVEKDTKKNLKFSQRFAYGLGHVLNDICASVWFSYILLYFQLVVGMPQDVTGSLLLIGQITDAFATPIIGIYSDYTGHRKLWHLIGTISTVVSFPFIFMSYPGYINYSDNGNGTEKNYTNLINSAVTAAWIPGLYYTSLIVVFQIGWAMVQISHLALIPIMTPLQSERAELTAIRFSASICSNIFMYFVMWFILHVTSNNGTALGAGDAFKFRDIVMIGLATGGAFTSCFHFILKVPNDSAKASGEKVQRGISSIKGSLNSYLTSLTLYQVSILYVSSRLFLTLNLVYMPLYLVENAGDKAEFIATVPMTFYIASFVSSLVIRQLNSCIGAKYIYLIGGVVSILGCIWIGIGLGRLDLIGELFSVAVLLGTGSSITMVSSLCLTADFIGSQTEHGAFVYSVVTFADKLLNGIVVMIIEQFKCKSYSHYYQDVLAFACGLTVFVGLIALVSIALCSLSIDKFKQRIKKFRISKN